MLFSVSTTDREVWGFVCEVLRRALYDDGCRVSRVQEDFGRTFTESFKLGDSSWVVEIFFGSFEQAEAADKHGASVFTRRLARSAETPTYRIR